MTASTRNSHESKRQRRNQRVRNRKRSRHEKRVSDHHDEELYWQASLDPDTLEGQMFIQDVHRLQPDTKSSSSSSIWQNIYRYLWS
jgi:hypothetical protein